jgi:hypothetical protein
MVGTVAPIWTGWQVACSSSALIIPWHRKGWSCSRANRAENPANAVSEPPG